MRLNIGTHMEHQSPTLLLAYEVMASDRVERGVLAPFLMQAARLHKETAVPCTFFVRGELLEPYQADFQRVRDLMGGLADFQQATWSGALLKTVCQENHRGLALFPAATLDDCCDEIARAADCMERALGVRPVGLAAPMGAYRGLSDRPDLLNRLDTLDVRFLRSRTRNFRDWYPVAFEVQPYRYAAQGLPHMIEIPGQGWPDCVLKETIRADSPDRYVQYVKKDLDYVAAKRLVWSLMLRDASVIGNDPEMTQVRAIIEYARNLGYAFQTHQAFCEAFPN